MASSGATTISLSTPNVFTALVTLNGGLVTTSVVKALSTKTTTYSVGALDEVILCDTTAGIFTITLPSAVGISGRVITIKKINGGLNALTIGSVAGLVEGVSSLAVSILNTSYEFISNGTDWFIMCQKTPVLI